MTLNVPVNNIGIPLAIPGQNFLLYRKNMQFQVKIDGVGKKTAKGTAYVTVFRIIFVTDNPTPQFFSFDVPIFLLFNQSVQFPLFGSTYLKGSVHPFQNVLPGDSHFKLWFKNGGCDTFVRILSKLIKQVRTYKNNQQQFVQQSQMYNDVRLGKFNFNAYVDPNDPSHIYVAQPK